MPGAIHPERYQPLVLYLFDIYRQAVRSAKAKIGRQFSKDIDFPQQSSIRRKLDHRSLAVPGNIKIAIDVAAHAIEPKVRKCFEQPFVGDTDIRLDIEHPDI